MASATFIVTVEWKFVSGKFASRESIVAAIQEQLENEPDLSQVDEGEYEVESFDVEAVWPAKKARKQRPRKTGLPWKEQV